MKAIVNVACLILSLSLTIGCEALPGQADAAADALARADAEPARFWDATWDDASDDPPFEALRRADPPDAAVSAEFAFGERHTLVRLASPDTPLAATVVAAGALLVWIEPGAGEPADVLTLALGPDGAALGEARAVARVARGADAPDRAFALGLTWDWRHRVVLLVIDRRSGPLVLSLDESGGLLAAPRALPPSDPDTPDVASASARTAAGFLLAHAAAPDRLGLVRLPFDPRAPLPEPEAFALSEPLPAAARLQIAHTAEADVLGVFGPVGGTLWRLDAPHEVRVAVEAGAEPAGLDGPLAEARRGQLLADGDGLLAVFARETPDGAGRVEALRLDAALQPRGPARLLAKMAAGAPFEARLRPRGGLVLRHDRHVTRFGPDLTPEGASDFLPPELHPRAMLWRRDAGLVCGEAPADEGLSFDCLTLSP